MYLKVIFFFNQTIILDMRLCLSSLSSIVHCCSIAVCNDLNVMWHKNKCEVQPYSADLERVCKKKNALPTFAKYYMLSTYLYLVNSAKMFAKHGWPTETEDTVNQNQTTDYKSPFSGVWPEKRNDTFSKKFFTRCFHFKAIYSPKLKKL